MNMATENIQGSDLHVNMSVAGMEKAYLSVRSAPGLVIFVHGVNSDGEWYEAAEQGLCAGLNARLGLNDAHDPSCQLSPVQYRPELHADGRMLNRELTGKNFIASEGFSPVIRFRWGYKAAGKDGTEGSEDEKEVYKSKIYLNELDAWGGGPFQNGTSALPYMWGLGLDDRVFWWLYANMFPVEGREVFASPPRAYFAHAAHRLKELIKTIRSKQPDCPLTVVCHSQGNMVTLAAALLGEREGAIADTYVLCNPPYSLESLGLDKTVNDSSKSAVGQFGSVTTLARKQTFKIFLDVVRKRAGASQSLDDINKWLEFKDPKTGKLVFQLGGFPTRPLAPYLDPTPGVDRDNRGRVFLYCNPHDQVIGVKPVEGIGWKGLSEEQLGEIGAEGVFHQRVWAQAGGNQTPPFKVGCKDWTERSYEYIAHNHVPKHFWNPPAPAMKYTLSLNEEQGAVSKIVTVVAAPLIWLVTHIPGLTFRINADPPKSWNVPITAPVLPQAVTPQASRFGRLGAFDELKDPAKDALADEKKKAKDRPNDAAHAGAYSATGQGDEQSEASLRYEHEARLRSARARGAVSSEDDERKAVALMLKENPNATDHSTILTNPMHSEKVLAYDVAVGWVNSTKITSDDLNQFRRFAHWMMLEEFELNVTLAKQFLPYWDAGFYNELQLHRTYTMEHMAANTRIVDERERSLLGHIK
jgi:pimeloyl-ACP methyl ester carboxylesterase